MIKQGGAFLQTKKIVLILLFIGAGFFCFNNVCLSIVDYVVINEVYYDPIEYSDTGKEWIELYNETANPIELTGYDLNAVSGDYYTFSNFTLSSGNFVVVHWRTDGADTATDLYTGTSGGFDHNMGNTNGWAALFNSTTHSDNTIIDYVEYGAGGQTWESTAVSAGIWTAGDYVIDVAEGHSFARKSAGFDTNQLSDFEDLSIPNPQNSGGESEPEPEPEEESEEEENEQQEQQEEEQENQEETLGEETQEEETAEPQNSGAVIITNKLGDIVINEFVSDPADEEVEWVELYNTTGEEIDLADWTIEEGSEAKTILEGIIGSSNESKFFIIEKPKGNLNNKGDIIIFRDSAGILIDKVEYGNWDACPEQCLGDGNIENNAPKASDPYSVARKFDGQNSFNNANDFAVTATMTKGASNIISKTEEEQEMDNEISAKEKANYDYSDDIIISEIFPNPEGSDNESEFIELYNKGDRDVDLTGWVLGDNSKRRYEIFDLEKDNIIKPKGYFVIFRSENKIALNNNGDSVKLYQPLKDESLQVVEYEKSIENWSYNLEGETSVSRLQDCNYVWSETVTPGEENIIEEINHAPIVDFDCPEKILAGVPFLFDGSDTIDENGDELKFNWDFGDGFTNVLPCPEHTFFKTGAHTIKLTVRDGENEAEMERIVKVVDDSFEGENLFEGETPASRLQINFRDNIIINEFLPDPKGSDADGEWIEIKNKSEIKINLLDWKLDDNINGSRPYKFAEDTWLGAGMFLSVDRSESGLALNNNFDSVRLLNNFDELIDEIEYEMTIEGKSYARGQNGKWFWTSVLTSGKENIISVSDSKVLGINNYEFSEVDIVQGVIETTLEEIKNFEPGNMVKVSGTVAVRPGILGSQYFYIVGSPGIQIYSYKKEFPDLKIGDYIEVQGELGVSAGEQRLKTKTIEDIKIIEHRDPPTAGEMACEDINENCVGRLVLITGEVVERKSSIVYLDDGTDEVIVYLKKSTGINSKSIKEGEMVTVTGLVGRTKSGIRIMPRSNDDIIKKDPQSHGAVSQVLGEVAVSDEWKIAMRDKKLELFKYLLVIAGGMIVALAGLLVRETRKA